MIQNLPEWKEREEQQEREHAAKRAMGEAEKKMGRAGRARGGMHATGLPVENSEGLNASVVIMNWKRPSNVRQILDAMVQYPAVGEVVVWMCNLETTFTYNHPKVRIIDEPGANDKFGLNVRFKACLEASQDVVLTVDDDVLPDEAAVNELVRAKLKDPDRLHSLHGRNPQAGCVYNFQQSPEGPASIVLTKMLATDHRFCTEHFRHTDLIEEFIKANAQPYWNGEDIFHSLVSTKVTGNKPIRHNLQYRKLPSMGEGISNRDLRGPKDYRTELLREATTKLQLPCSTL
jgi:hypothetical protein